MTQAAGDDREAGTPWRIALRRSLAVRLAVLVFTLVCAAAVRFTAAPHMGAAAAVWLSFAACAALGVSFMRYERRQPAWIELTPEGVAAFDDSGRALLQGRIAGAAQWAGQLLVLAVAGVDGRQDTLVVAADAVPAAVFRELAVRARHTAH